MFDLSCQCFVCFHKVYFANLMLIICFLFSKDQVVCAVLENFQDPDKEINCPNNNNQDLENNCDQGQHKVERAISWRKIVDERDYYSR